MSAGTQKAFPVGASRERLGPEPPGTSNNLAPAVYASADTCRLGQITLEEQDEYFGLNIDGLEETLRRDVEYAWPPREGADA